MDQAEFDRVAASFAAFHADFAPLFGRKEAQRRGEDDHPMFSPDSRRHGQRAWRNPAQRIGPVVPS